MDECVDDGKWAVFKTKVAHKGVCGRIWRLL
jgi:hypothetical protein